MENLLLLELSLIPVIGICSMWLAWRLGLPSILILLIAGILSGPILGFVNPNHLMGHMLFPFVSISVAIIMFEGGLSLKITDIRNFKKVVWNLVTFGNVITWLVLSTSSIILFDFDWRVGVLLGSILVVTGPTVVTPLLRFIKPTRQVSSVLRWEGILIDPIVAIQSVLLLDVILASSFEKALGIAALMIFKTIVIGLVTGLLGALILVTSIRKNLIPEFLQESVTLVLVIGIYALSNIMQAEAGLLSVTIMGIIFTNQKVVTVQRIIDFKENLTLILLGSLFIILSSRLELEALLDYFNYNSFIFLLIVIFVARPLSVFACTFKSSLSIRERFFISWMAPRGLVAAAVASLFSIRLDSIGIQGSEALVSVTFLVIIFTVIIYGLTSQWVGKFLRVTRSDIKGVLFVGAHEWSRKIALFLQKEHFPVFMVDTNRSNIMKAEEEGLPSLYGSILSQKVLEIIQENGVGKLLALTPSDDLNRKAIKEFANSFSLSNVYRLYPSDDKASIPGQYSSKIQERYLFEEKLSWTKLDGYFKANPTLERKEFKNANEFESFLNENADIVPLFIKTVSGKLFVCTVDRHIIPKTVKVMIYLRLEKPTPSE